MFGATGRGVVGRWPDCHSVRTFNDPIAEKTSCGFH